MKCFYHNDADGRCAAFWVSMGVGLRNWDEHDIEYIEMDYNKKFPLDSIGKDEQVYIVDYSISTDEMRSLLNITKNVIWIDHHKTAIERFKDFEYDIKGIRYDGIAGCMLTFCYIYYMAVWDDNDIKPFNLEITKDAPLFTKLIADWDVWKFDFGDDTRHFITAFNAYDFSPLSKNWDMFQTKEDGGLIEEGKTMIKFRDNWAKEVCKSKGFETEFEGHKCFALNVPHCNSEYFKSIDDGTYEILIPFSFDGTKWTASLYSKTVDVSEIAKKYGGGGHRGASGFSSDKLLFYKK